jgi:hypothetical protein
MNGAGNHPTYGSGYRWTGIRPAEKSQELMKPGIHGIVRIPGLWVSGGF